MPLQYDVGQKFPSLALVDDRGAEVSIEEVAGKRPLILAFYRGPW
jgi:peroxiredoxin